MPSTSRFSRGGFRFWKVIVAAFVSFQLVDGVLTGIGVHFFGLDLEANPVAAYIFASWGILPGVLAAKGISFLIFFSLLWYCIKVRWSIADIVRYLRHRQPKRDPAYAMMCFNVAGVITTAASLYAGGGWVYLLLMLHGTNE